MHQSHAKSKILYLCLYAAVSALFVLYFAHSVSPLSTWQGADSAIFKQMGLAMLEGKTPYTDLFDHNGILLYALYALGSLVPGKWGIYLLSVICLTATLRLWHKTARLFLAGWKSLLPPLIGLAAYSAAIVEGGLAEDWALPFIAYGIYVLALYLHSAEVPFLYRSFNVGACIATVGFMGINNAVPLLIIALILLSVILTKRKMKYLRQSLFCLLSGMLLPTLVLIAVVYLAYGSRGVGDMFYGTFAFNLRHVLQDGAAVPSLHFVVHSLLVLYLLTLAMVRLVKRRPARLGIMLALLLLTFLCIGRGGHYNHYAVLAPLYVLICALITSKAESRATTLLLPALPFILLFGVKIASGVDWIASNGQVLPDDFYPQTRRAILSIPAAERSRVWNYNTESDLPSALAPLRLTQCNRVIRPSHAALDTGLNENIQDGRPQWIALSEGGAYLSPSDSAYICRHYALVHRTQMESHNLLLFRKR